MGEVVGVCVLEGSSNVKGTIYFEKEVKESKFATKGS
jgi:hypothetical protein